MEKVCIVIVLGLILGVCMGAALQYIRNNSVVVLTEPKTQMMYKQPDIHLTHEYYVKGTNLTTLQVSYDTMFFNNGMRTTDYTGFYIYEIPNTSAPKYYVHTTTVNHTVESVLIGDNTRSRTESVLHLFLPRTIMEKIVMHQTDQHYGLSGLNNMVWTGEYIIKIHQKEQQV